MLRTIIIGFLIIALFQNSFPAESVAVRNKTSKEIVEEIRKLMSVYEVVGAPIQAYIVPCTDEHQNEYVSEHDKRLKFVTGFTGSNGEACITAKAAAFWTDSRYHIQAEQQLDSEVWTLMKEGEPNVDLIDEWLCKVLPPNSRVGIDPMLILASDFAALNERLLLCGHELVAVNSNLVHLVWNATRPKPTHNSLRTVDMHNSGKKASQKLAELIAELQQMNVRSQVISQLDEVAWLLNLRGSDLEFSPLFFAHVIVTVDRKVYLHLAKSDRFTDAIYNHCYMEGITVIPKTYDSLLVNIHEVLRETNGKMLLSKATYGIVNSVPADRRVEASSPIVRMKAIKNKAEAEGMRMAHLRDGAAVIRYLHWLDVEIDDRYITELSGAKQLDKFRNWANDGANNYKHQQSFETISAVGEHAALPHYTPTPPSDKQITRDEIYLIDSGAQYLDGTTDITRTVHFGTPKEREIDAFTRVLKGFIAIQTAHFPPGAKPMFLDGLARRPLWDAGITYHHGTGHGIGAGLNVHEYPPAIHSQSDGHGLQKNMFTSNEPGYYERGSFGIRIEDVIQVVDLPDSAHFFSNKGALCFQDVTMVPIQKKLMNVTMLTDKEIAWINEYHQMVRDKITPLLGNNWTVLNWLNHETTPIVRETKPTEPIPDGTNTISTTHGDISADNKSEM